MSMYICILIILLQEEIGETKHVNFLIKTFSDQLFIFNVSIED